MMRQAVCAFACLVSCCTCDVRLPRLNLNAGRAAAAAEIPAVLGGRARVEPQRPHASTYTDHQPGAWGESTVRLLSCTAWMPRTPHSLLLLAMPPRQEAINVWNPPGLVEGLGSLAALTSLRRLGVQICHAHFDVAPLDAALPHLTALTCMVGCGRGGYGGSASLQAGRLAGLNPRLCSPTCTAEPGGRLAGAPERRPAAPPAALLFGRTLTTSRDRRCLRALAPSAGWAFPSL